MSLKVNQLTVLAFKGFAPPDDYIQKIVDNYHTANGAVFAEDGVLQIAQQTGPIDFETLKEWFTIQQDLTLLTTFSNAEKELLEADLQPFILLRDAKDRPLVAGSIIGDFLAAEDDGSERSNIGLAVETLIQPLQ